MEKDEVIKWAGILKRYATHHVHDDWPYSRDKGAIMYAVHERDYFFDSHYLKEIRGSITRAFTGVRRVRKGSIDALLYKPGKLTLKDRLFELSMVPLWLKRSVLNNRIGYDGMVNGNLFLWEEDGEYVNVANPKVGALLADWMIAEPESEFAQKIAAQIKKSKELTWEGVEKYKGRQKSPFPKLTSNIFRKSDRTSVLAPRQVGSGHD